MTSQTPMQPPTGGTGPSGPRANFGQRLGAYLIDVILIDIIAAIALVINRGLGYAVAFGLGLVYFAYFEGGATGQTLGKRALGIRVYDVNGRGPIGFGRGLLRYIGRLISGFVCLLGYLWMLWDREKQTWHDKIASTVVVPVRDYPVT